VHFLIEHPLPAPGAGQRLAERTIRLPLRSRRKLASVRRDDALAAAAALEFLFRWRHGIREKLQDVLARHAALTSAAFCAGWPA
jgi:hypothetical protein